MNRATAQPLVADLWGRVMLDYHVGIRETYAFRHRGGFLDDGHSAEVYFAAPERFFPWEADLLDAVVRGPVLDVGAGPGRMALWAQAQGLAVVAVDASPLTVTVALERGVTDVRLGEWQALERLLLPEEDDFGAVFLLGHNPGLAGSLAGLARLLARLHGRTQPAAVLLATSIHPAAAAHPAQERSRAGEPPSAPYAGELEIRVEYGGAHGPWFPWLLVDVDELAHVAGGAGWFLERLVQGEEGAYGVVLRRVG